MTPADALELAAGVVDDGWRQGRCADDQGRRCAIGALNKAVPLSRNDVYMAAVTHLADYVGDCCVAAWNDKAGRTADEVSAAMRACAAELRAAS